MTKQVNNKNQIWYEQTEQGVTKIGFTRSFLDGMDQCWHILPGNMERFREKAPLMVVETNDALVSILSPITGNFGQWSVKAQDFPNQLTEDDVVMEIRQGPRIEQPMDEVPDHPRVMGRRGPLTVNMGAVPQGFNPFAVEIPAVVENGRGIRRNEF